MLVFIAAGQPLMIGLMATQTDYGLLAATLLALAFVFGQIPITDAVIARYVPDIWRTKVMSVKFMLNLKLDQAVVFKNGQPRLMHGRVDNKLLGHRTPPRERGPRRRRRGFLRG